MFFLSKFITFLVLMTPFFVLSMFIAMTIGWAPADKRKLAVKVGIALFIMSQILLFCGNLIFDALGITLDSFRIGGGAMLFLSAVGLVNSNVLDKKGHEEQNINTTREIFKIAVVPLAIPITIGPATIAVLLIQSAEYAELATMEQLTLPFAIAAAVAALTLILFVSTWIEEKLGHNMIIVMSKLTGLILAAMASQMIFTGIKGFWTVMQ